MEVRSVSRIVFILGMTAALGAPTWAQEQTKEQKQQEREQRAANQAEKRKAEQAARQQEREQRAQQQQANRQAQQSERQANREQAAKQQQEAQQAQQNDRAQRAQQQEANQRAQQAERQRQRAEMDAQRQQNAQGRNERIRQQQAAEQDAARQQQAAQQDQAQANADAQQRQAIQNQRQDNRQQRVENRAARLSAARQQQLIKEQQGWNTQYKTLLQRQELQAQRRAVELQNARRLAQYRYQQRYYDRLRQQQMMLGNRYDYYNDPYYYTAPNYRYQRGGQYYETNEYGADLLRQAVNVGYEEGVRAAQADREDGYRGDYRSHYAYQDGTLGYTGRYVGQNDYSYYFREGFQRGYEDGFSNSYRYGSNNNGTLGILGTVLATILNLQQLR